jgi:hypothetical protein
LRRPKEARIAGPRFLRSAASLLPMQPELGGPRRVIGPITPELKNMPRFLPQYLIFLAAHVLLIGMAVAVAALN